MQSTILSLYVLLVCQTAWGILFPFERNKDYNPDKLQPSHTENSYEALLSRNDHFEIYNSSLNQTDDSITESSREITNDTIFRNDENNSTMPTSNQSAPSASSTSAISSTSDIQNAANSTTVVSNKPQSQSSTELSSSGSPAVTNGGTTSTKQFNTVTTSSNNETNATTLTTDDDEPEGVARGKPTTTETVTTTTPPQTLYQRGLALIGDPYILSILIPVTAGVVFATSIILTIATCRCIRRRCLRRRLRRKILPDSVKNLRPSDRARLLAESSDEEF